MSVCKRPVTVGFSAPGKWTYVYGDFANEPLDISAAVILDGAVRFAATRDGLIPWKERPDGAEKGRRRPSCRPSHPDPFVSEP